MADELTLNGELVLRTGSGAQVRLRIDGPGGNIWAGGNGQDGDIVIFRSTGDNETLAIATIHIDGNGGNIWAGGQGTDGDLVLLPSSATNINDLSQATIHLDGQSGTIQIRNNLRAGGNGADGDIVLFPSGANPSVHAQATIHLDADGGNIWAGGRGADGDLVLFPSSASDINSLNQATIHLDANGGNIWAGGKGTDGDLVLFPSSATDINNLSQATIHLDGQAGDINLLNADAAEEFEFCESGSIEPGDVLVINEDLRLGISSHQYDKRVAGVVSGAGDCRPGIVLGRDPAARGKRVPVALIGKVFCKADADSAPIELGDLLTTSSLPGHAMKAADVHQAFGAVIGKALAPMRSGTGMLPILAALQ